MSAPPPAVRDHQSPLEAALLDVHATLGELLAVAHEQRAAIETGDHDHLDAVTRLQERLTARLEAAERRRMAAMGAGTLAASIALLPDESSTRAAGLHALINEAVLNLRDQHARNAALLQRSTELAGETLSFLQRLVVVQSPTYGDRRAPSVARSLLVDSRA